MLDLPMQCLTYTLSISLQANILHWTRSKILYDKIGQNRDSCRIQFWRVLTKKSGVPLIHSVIFYLKTGESQVQMMSSCLMVIKLFEYKFYSSTPNLLDQNVVFIEYDVLIGWGFFSYKFCTLTPKLSNQNAVCIGYVLI